MKRCVPRFLAAAAAALAAGCYPDRWTSNYDSFPDFTESQNAVLDETSLSDEEKARRDAELKRWNEMPEPEYRINAGDAIHVVVYNNADLSFDTVVTPDGHIGMVFVGQLKVAGLTLKEAADLISSTLADYVKKPAVGVIPSRISSECVTIAGATKSPGMFNISNGIRPSHFLLKAKRTAPGMVAKAAMLKMTYFIRAPATSSSGRPARGRPAW